MDYRHPTSEILEAYATELSNILKVNNRRAVQTTTASELNPTPTNEYPHPLLEPPHPSTMASSTVIPYTIM